MQEQIISAKTPRGRRAAKFLATSVALTMATFGGIGAVAGTAYAFSGVTTQGYVIAGAAATVTGVTASVNPATVAPGGTTGNYTLKFATPSALTVGASASVSSCINIVDQDNAGNTATGAILSTVVNSATTGVGIVDPTTGYAFTASLSTAGNGFLGTMPLVSTHLTAALAATSTSAATAETTNGKFLVVCLGGSGSVNAGDTLTLTFAAANPAAGTAYSFWVNSSANTTWQQTNTLSITATGSPTVAAGTTQAGTATLYTFTNITVPTVPGASGSATELNLQDCQAGASALEACTTDGTIIWPGTAASYTISEAPASGSAIAIAVGTATYTPGPGANTGLVTLAGLSPALTTGDVLTITANAPTPPAGPETDTFQVGFLTATATFTAVDTNTLSFGNPTNGVTVTASPSAASASSTWTVGFNASATGAFTGGSIVIQGPAGTTFASPTGVVVTDATTGATQVVSAIVPSQTNTAADTITIAVTLAIADSNALTVTVFGVTNPVAGSYSGSTGVSVSTKADAASTNAAALVIGPTVVSSASPTVTVTPNTAGQLATYTVGPFKAANALVGGSDTLQVTAVSGTEFPGTATLTDSTTASGSQALTYNAGQGTDAITYNIVSNIAAGDSLTLTMTAVVNPAGTAVGSTDSLTLGADTSSANTDKAGTQGLATPQIPFVAAASTYPDGGIVSFAGTDYSFAGGHAFAIAAADLTAFQAVDKATVQTAATGATVPTTAAATGAVILAINNPTIYVVGTDGQLHGFATPAQFMGDGYDPAAVILVDSITGLTVGATAGSVGSGANAVATSANGAIADSSGTFYVFAGGRAFGFPGPKSLLAVEAEDAATPLTAAVSSAQTGATIRQGTVVTINSAVYVANANNNLLPFKSMNQLTKDGYGGTPSILLPGVGGLGIVTGYSGS